MQLGRWRGHAGAFVPEAIEITLWDQFLDKLGLTEREALDAIIREGDLGKSIRRFVRESCHNHFIPEDVLHAMNLRRDVAKGALNI